jgi:hypothetical protein
MNSFSLFICLSRWQSLIFKTFDIPMSTVTVEHVHTNVPDPVDP